MKKLTPKTLSRILENLEDRLIRRKRAPAGMIYQIKKHRKVIQLENTVRLLKSAIQSA